jgi:hypothetical protein
MSAKTLFTCDGYGCSVVTAAAQHRVPADWLVVQAEIEHSDQRYQRMTKHYCPACTPAYTSWLRTPGDRTPDERKPT